MIKELYYTKQLLKVDHILSTDFKYLSEKSIKNTILKICCKQKEDWKFLVPTDIV
jgi:hypothetical protein